MDNKPRPMPNETLTQSTRKKRLERPRMAFDPYMKRKKRKIKNPDDPETDDLIDEEDPDDDDDDDATGTTSTTADDDETSGGDEDENELQQLDGPIKPIQENPFEKGHKPVEKKEIKEQPKGPEKTQRSPWQQFIDFLVHGAHGAMIKNGDISTKPSIISNILAGLGFKSFKKDVLLQEQAKEFWKQKTTGKKVDMRLLNTDRIDKKIQKEERMERQPFLFARKEQKNKNIAQMQKELAHRIHEQIRSQNIQAQQKIEQQALSKQQRMQQSDNDIRQKAEFLKKTTIALKQDRLATQPTAKSKEDVISSSKLKMSKEGQTLLKQIQEARENREKNDIMQAQQMLAQQTQQAQMIQQAQLAQQTQQALNAQQAQLAALSMAVPKPQPIPQTVLPPVPPKQPTELSDFARAAALVEAAGGIKNISKDIDARKAGKGTDEHTSGNGQPNVTNTLGENGAQGIPDEQSILSAEKVQLNVHQH